HYCGVSRRRFRARRPSCVCGLLGPLGLLDPQPRQPDGRPSAGLRAHPGPPIVAVVAADRGPGRSRSRNDTAPPGVAGTRRVPSSSHGTRRVPATPGGSAGGHEMATPPPDAGGPAPFDPRSLGIAHTGRVFANLSAAELSERAVKNKEGVLTDL